MNPLIRRLIYQTYRLTFIIWLLKIRRIKSWSHLSGNFWVNTQKLILLEKIWVFTQKISFNMKDLKYLFAYTVPLSVYVSFISSGIWTFSSVFYVFIVIPLLDLIFGEAKENLSDGELSSIDHKWIFDLMLYLNFPIVLACYP